MIGRLVDGQEQSSNNLKFNSKVVSRQHAMIFYENGKVTRKINHLMDRICTGKDSSLAPFFASLLISSILLLLLFLEVIHSRYKEF